MARLEHAAIATVLLVAFVADLRIVVPAVTAVVVAGVALRHGGRAGLADVALLAVSCGAFLLGNEVAAWTTALAAAVVSGLRAATSTGPRRVPTA